MTSSGLLRPVRTYHPCRSFNTEMTSLKNFQRDAERHCRANSDYDAENKNKMFAVIKRAFPSELKSRVAYKLV